MKISFIDNGKKRYWYAVCFMIHEGKPRLYEAKYPILYPSSMPVGKERDGGLIPPPHVISSLTTKIEAKASEVGGSIGEYPDMDVKRKKMGIVPVNPVTIANQALLKMSQVSDPTSWKSSAKVLSHKEAHDILLKLLQTGQLPPIMKPIDPDQSAGL